MKKYIKFSLFGVAIISILINLIFGILVFNSWQYSQQITETYLENTISLREFENSLKNKFVILEKHICKENLVPIGDYTQVPRVNLAQLKTQDTKILFENYELVYQEKSIENYLAFLAFTQGRKDFGFDDSNDYFIPKFIQVSWQKIDTQRGCLLPIKSKF